MDTMKNADLYEALKEYCKTVTTLFKERIKQTDLPLKDEPRFKEFGPGAVFTDTVMKVDWQFFMITIEKQLWELDAYQRALQAMTDDQTIAKHLNTLVGRPGAGRRVESPEYLRWFVAQLLNDQQGFDFQEGVFQKLYEDFEDFFYRDSFEYRVVAPLHNFKMQAERFTISPKLSIIKIPTEERAQMLAKWSHDAFSVHPSLHNEFALEILVEAPKAIGEMVAGPGENDPLSVARRAFDDVCDTLRLFKSGAVFYAEYGMEPTSWNVTGIQSAWPGLGSPGYLYGATYTLSDDEAPIFLELWKSPRKETMEKHKSILIAFNRLGFGYERLRLEDKLIDFMIGLEALFLDVEDELSYRLSLRVAALLGDTPEKRERIFTELRKAYGLRSNIAHGNSPKKDINIDGDKIPFVELVNRVEEYLRAAIKAFLGLGINQNKKKFLLELDKHIARGFSPIG